MLIISKFLLHYKDHPVVESIFLGIRPAVVGLLVAASLLLMTRENFSSPGENGWQFCISILLFLFAFFGQRVYHINPIRLIALCAIAGAILL
jgi:chromate transporter